MGVYISVQKGTRAGISTLYAQQTQMIEQDGQKLGNIPFPLKCQRKETIQAPKPIKWEQQDQDHEMILMTNAKQP